MSDEPTTAKPDVEQAPGWYVTDPDGNIVDSGPVTEAQATAWVGEMLAEASRNEGEQQ
jgi:hypothetical protein